MAGIWGPTGAMPPAVAALHGDEPETEARGIARVDRGTGLLARLVARRLGFPPSAAAVPLHVRITRTGDGETWTRSFAGDSFTSHMSRRGGRVVEHFGALAFAFDLEPIAAGHAMVLRRWWCGPWRLPLALAPRITATESDDRGRFAFDVRIDLPLFGRLIAYRGSLAIVPKAANPAQWSLADEHRTLRRHRG